MCGRYGLIRPTEFSKFVRGQFPVDFGELRPRYNIAPSQTNPIIANGEDGMVRAAAMRWGLVPFWEKADRPKFAPINARSEEAFSKTMFKRAIQDRRALIPADVFYEWKRIDEKVKIPHAIVLASLEPFFIASIYEQATALRPETYAMLTTRPNQMMESIHNRMPVILKPEAAHRWLTAGVISESEFSALCVPYPTEEMHAFPVSSIVNNPRNDTEECVLPVLTNREPAGDLLGY
jgi:putative SOS response-associated peptidase YedK